MINYSLIMEKYSSHHTPKFLQVNIPKTTANIVPYLKKPKLPPNRQNNATINGYRCQEGIICHVRRAPEIVAQGLPMLLLLKITPWVLFLLQLIHSYLLLDEEGNDVTIFQRDWWFFSESSLPSVLLTILPKLLKQCFSNGALWRIMETVTSISPVWDESDL